MSIYEGIDDIIDSALGLSDIGSRSPHYNHKRSCLRLSTGPPSGFDTLHLLKSMLSRLERNWTNSPRRRRAEPSDKNWHWKKQLTISAQNRSPEKTLEKRIVQLTGAEWVNQIPTASGLYAASRDRQRNVDLVQQIDDGRYQLIELKVDSDTPLKAAIEITQYAVFYVFARLHYSAHQQAAKKLLRAKTLHLRVLAPRPYYAGYHLGWLVPALNKGLAVFPLEYGLPLQMDFDFLWFPPTFVWPCSDEESLAAVRAISPVQWGEPRDGT